MSGTTSTTARLTALEGALDEIVTLLKGRTEAPAKTTRKANKRVAKKAPAAKKAATKAPSTVRALSKKSRLAFVKAAPEFEGMSTKAIAEACIKDPSRIPVGFEIGAGYTALFS